MLALVRLFSQIKKKLGKTGFATRARDNISTVRINLVVNDHRQDAVEAALMAIDYLRERGVTVATEPESSATLKISSLARAELGKADLVITFGGDGTLIRAADLCSEHGTPVLGVNFGRFGFVTQCQPADITSSIDRFLAGEATFDHRMMLQSELLRNGQPIASLHALNEVALQRSVNARMLSVGVVVDGHFLTSYPADGILLSTPTGSTAYNLSVGGPVIDPGVKAITLTAIAPHTLSARPLVMRPDSEVVLTVQTEGDAILSADSHTRLHLLSGDAVRVTQSPRVTHLMCAAQDDFLTKLSERLLWSQSILGGRNEL